MAKRLSNVEVKTLKNVIINRIGLKRLEKVHSVLIKDEQFVKCVEREIFLENEIYKLSEERSKLLDTIKDKIKEVDKLVVYNSYGVGGTFVKFKCRYISFNDWSTDVEVGQELILKNISRDIDVDKLIEEIVNKY